MADPEEKAKSVLKPNALQCGNPIGSIEDPFGAATALTGVLLLAGDFVPGFTAVDKQTQILAYAILFGFGQQFFTSTWISAQRS